MALLFFIALRLSFKQLCLELKYFHLFCFVFWLCCLCFSFWVKL